jgi:uncharacterized membrane protein YqjE
MPEVGSTVSGRGLLGSLKRLAHTLLEIAETRLDLLSNEVQLEAVRLARIAIFGAAALLFLCFTVMLATLLVIAALWNVIGMAGIALFVVLYGAIGVVLLMRTMRLATARSFMFQASVAELAKDRERLMS